MNSWIALALIAPLFWAGSNFVDKYVLGKYTKGIVDYLFFSSITCWIFFLAILFFVGVPDISVYTLIPIGTGMALIYSYGFYARALEQGDTSSLVILFKLIPVFTVILGYVFLEQSLSNREWLGFIIVLLGAVVVTLEKRLGSFIKGFGMILAAIIIWSVMTLFIDFGLTKITFWEYFMLDNLGSALAGLTLLILPAMRKQVKEGIWSATRGKYTWFLWNNILDFFGQMSIKKALAIAPAAGLVTVIMQVQSFYAIVIGIVLTLMVPQVIKEDISFANLSKKVLGAAVMFAGIYVVLS
ncbi:MAG TPA: DMT family transporter [Verrucomicrobiae bacterium]|nr:DMT family transporter [Verrucomicrobiae bacterium]